VSELIVVFEVFANQLTHLVERLFRSTQRDVALNCESVVVVCVCDMHASAVVPSVDQFLFQYHE
jgi:hypothetical protein